MISLSLRLLAVVGVTHKEQAAFVDAIHLQVNEESRRPLFDFIHENIYRQSSLLYYIVLGFPRAKCHIISDCSVITGAVYAGFCCPPAAIDTLALGHKQQKVYTVTVKSCSNFISNIR